MTISPSADRAVAVRPSTSCALDVRAPAAVDRYPRPEATEPPADTAAPARALSPLGMFITAVIVFLFAGGLAANLNLI
jgi:hypothetical protein